MRKLYFLFIIVFTMSCSDNDKYKEEIAQLRSQNDSLNTVLDTLKTKFIFDHAFVKHIVNHNKPLEFGKNYQGEFYFVAYNEADKLLFKQKTENKFDTLIEVKGGGYIYNFIAKEGENDFYFKPYIIDETAKEFRNGSFFDVQMADSRTLK
jgi:hypothetical protein